MESEILKSLIFPVVLKRIEERKDSLVPMGKFDARGIEGWFRIEIVAALVKTNYPVIDVRNRGIDLVLKGGLNVELKGQTNFVPSEIKVGLKYGTPCLFLANGKDKRKIEKLESYDDVELLCFEIISDGTNEWVMGLIGPASNQYQVSNTPNMNRSLNSSSEIKGIDEKRQMAEHEKIDPKIQLTSYVLDKNYSSEAKELNNFISSIKPELRAYCYQYPTNQSYTCWFIGFADRQNPYILHFNIEHTNRKDGAKFRVWFRRPRYESKDGVINLLSDEGFNKTTQDQNFRWMPIIDLENSVKQIIVDYVKAVRKHLLQGKLKPESQHKKCQINLS